MLRPLSLLPALVLAATTWVGWSAPAEAAQAARPDDPDAPLSVSIETMSPSTVPDRGPVVITGRVTNDSDVTWSTINLYPFISAQPLTTRTELVEATATAPSASVGDRVTTRGPYYTIDELAPGDTAFYTVRVRSADLRAHVAEKGGDLDANAGAYWFGVHALGRSATDAGTSAPTADGRARTFLPRAGGAERQVKTALVVPLRAAIEYDDDGSIAGPAAWSSSLATDGRLGSAVRFGAAAGSRPLTWLIDPALTDVTARLAAGNPGRSLGATVDPEATEDPDRLLADPEDPAATPPPETETPLPSPETSAGGEDGSDEQAEEVAPEKPTAVEEAAARSATAWRDRFGDALESAEVLALPYGDLDVPAAAEHDAAAYTEARQRSGSSLQPWEIPTSPALGGRAFLDPDSIELAGDDETLIGSDLMVPELGAEAPAVVTVDGRRVVLASAAVASGGPGPDDPLAGVAVRQRILAEAAVRRQDTPREPLVVVLPSGWSADDADGFFDGLEQPWLDLSTVTDVLDEPATKLDPAQVVHPRAQARRQLDASVFASARELSEAGTTLQYLLTRNDTVGREVSDQALTSLSFASRADPAAARSGNVRSSEVLEELLDGVRIEAPRQVTLSSASGRFSATLENTLDQPVTVRVRAVAEEPITITMTEEDVTLPPRSRRSVLLTASTEQQGVHNITLQVTDMAGTIVGTSDRLPIRAAQVSNVIWLIIGTGAALLLGAIGVRLARRIRAARRTSGDGEGPGDTRHEAEATEQTPTPRMSFPDTSAREDAAETDRKILASSAVMAAGTIVSRLSGFVRSALLAAALGAYLHADIFTIANTIPNMLYILLAGGVFNAVLVPQLVRAMRDDPDGGEAYTNRVVTLGALFLGAVTILLVLAAPLVMSLYLDPKFDGPDLAAQRESIIDFARLCLPQVFFYGMFVLVGQILNSRGKFGPMMWAPIANNVISVLVLVVYLLTFGPAEGDDRFGGFTSGQELLLGLGSTAGIVAQLLILVPFLRAAGFTFRPRFDFRGTGLGHTFRLAVWTVLFVIVNQIAYTVVVRLASSGTVGGTEDGTGYMVYSSAFLIVMVPHSVITVSLATAILPRLSARAAEGDLAGLARTLTGTLRTALAVLLPFAALLPLVAPYIAQVVWGHGAAADDFDSYVPTLALFGPGVVFFTVHYLMLRGFYALERTRTVFFIQCWVAATNIVVALVLVLHTDAKQTSPALVVAYSASYAVGAAISYGVLRRVLGGLRTGELVRFLVRLLLATAISTGIALAVAWPLHRAIEDSSWLPALLAGGLVTVVDVVAFLVLARLLRLREVTSVLQTVTRRRPPAHRA